ncbi:Alpha-2-MRAP_C, Alpha-2-macroglobulin RAP, C-terminal [Francisella orientalis str. Toba 04]
METLYYKDLERLQQKAKELSIIERDSDSFSEYEEKMHIYYSYLSEAYNNDIRNNQEPKINDDERCILNVLSSKLNINNDDKVVIEYMIRPCDK